jgi:hypothetical protein
LVGGRLIAKALPWAVGLSSGAGFVLLCLKTNAGHVYTTAATILFVFVAADLVFVLRTGRLRLSASYEVTHEATHEATDEPANEATDEPANEATEKVTNESKEFRALDLQTGRVVGSLIAATVLALLIVGALQVGFGRTFNTGLSWWTIHGSDFEDYLYQVAQDSIVAVGAVVTTALLGRAIWRRDWGRALMWLWTALALWSLTNASAGAWVIYRSHPWWWAYPWFFGWVGVAITFGVLAANAKEAEEAADRKQKRQDRQPEREDAHSGSGDETSMTQPGSGMSAAPLYGRPEGAGRGKSRQDTDRRHPR